MKKTEQDIFDPKFIEKFRPFFKMIEMYFRYEAVGLENIPTKGGCLVVMNHGILPYHGFLFAKAVIDQLHRYPRGLGADFLFELPLVREFFLKGGALRANPQNGEKLLKGGNIVMLAPGGIYEALIAKKGMRRIPWEHRKGFVELAIKTGCPIVPTYCQGINSAYYNSYLLLKPRIKLFEKIRFSMPFFIGLGLLPFPVKLTHVVGKPVRITKKKGETHAAQVERIHQQIIAAEARLAKTDL